MDSIAKKIPIKRYCTTIYDEDEQFNFRGDFSGLLSNQIKTVLDHQLKKKLDFF